MKRILILCLLLVGCTCPAPKPDNPNPILPEESPDLILMRGETSEIRLPGPGCPTIAPVEGITTEVLEFRPVTTTRPSFIGARVGEYLDALVPCETGKHGVWIDVTGLKDGRYDAAGKSVLVLPIDMPRTPAMPFYTEVAADAVSDNRLNVALRAPIIKEWNAFMRAHRIEPIKQYLTAYPPANLSQWSEMGADFFSLVIEGAIAPPMLIRYEPTTNPSVATLQALEAAIQTGRIPPEAWHYVRDEGELGSDGNISQANLKVLRDKAALSKTHAPSMKRYATWRDTEAVRDVLDGAWPVAEWWNGEPGIYFSCMAQGQCSDGGPREPTGTPLSVIEAPEIHLMMQPVMAYALGAKRAMYYTVTKRLRTAWEPGGQWNEGGNGDGTATYIHAGKPAASVRLKSWRYGQNTVEYLRALGRDGKDLVRSPKDWNKEHGPLDALRVELARKLGAL